jgi:hypothetical protein
MDNFNFNIFIISMIVGLSGSVLISQQKGSGLVLFAFGISLTLTGLYILVFKQKKELQL